MNKILSYFFPIAGISIVLYIILIVAFVINSETECRAKGANGAIHTLTFKAYCNFDGKYELLK